jgi:hypothetical protein
VAVTISKFSRFPHDDGRAGRKKGKEENMSLEDKEGELGLLLTRMQNEPESWHELYEQIRLKLNELKAYGMPLPEDLVQFEHDLEAEFEAEQEDEQRRARLNKVFGERAKR